MRAPRLTLPSAFETRPGAADPALASASLDRWWLLFADPQLHQLIDQAMVSAPTAEIALARITESAATRRARLDQFLPTGTLNGSASQQHSEVTGTPSFTGGGGFSGGGGGFSSSGTGGDTTSLSASFNPTWEIDLFGRSRVGRRGVEADFAATRFNIEASRMSLAAQVAQALFQARALAVQLEDARETLRLRRETSRVGRVRSERGIGSGADAARFEGDAQTAEAETTRLEAALSGAKRTLLVLIGRGTDPLDSLPIEARADAPPAVPATTPGELLARRPDVREAEARLRVETATVQTARLALFPKFTLAPGASLSKSTGASDFTSTVWSLGVNATMPMLDRFRLMQELKAEKARGEQAVINYEKAVQTAYGDAETTLNTLQADQIRTGRLEAAEKNARFAFDAATRGYGAGLTDVTSLLDSERTWRAARSALTNARAQALQDAVAAFKALGGGWSPPPLKTAAADRAS